MTDFESLISNSKRFSFDDAVYILNTYCQPELHKDSILTASGKLRCNIPITLHNLLHTALGDDDTQFNIAEDNNFIYIFFIEKKAVGIYQIIPKHSGVTHDILKDIIKDKNIARINFVCADLQGAAVIDNKLASAIVFLYDNSLLSLAGKGFKNLRKQLNAIENIPEKKVSIEYQTMANLPIGDLIAIQNLIEVWKEQSKSAQEGYLKSISTIIYEQLQKGNNIKEKLDNLHITLIKDYNTGELICYGIDHLLPYNVVALSEGKMNYNYTSKYPDLNKLINYFELKNVVEKHYLDTSKVSFTLDMEVLSDIKDMELNAGYYNFKRQLAPNKEIYLGSVGKHKDYIVYLNSSKRSIF